LGGARINDVFDILKNKLEKLSTFVVIIHIGTNDVNKVYKPVKDQLLENLQLQYVHILKQQETMMGWEQTEEKLKYN
jgi:hypothetical protein